MKSGRKYNSLIAASSCTSHDLGTGNTFHTVSKMRDWVLQDFKQVSALSRKLKKDTLQKTIKSVHAFLYDHIKYKADGAKQVIKSPGCAWATRNEGTDCKTFSVFASAILTNLGIPHAIRQVRQPGVNSELWTHVYVVVPVDPRDEQIKGNYYVLDGTVQSNREVRTLEVKDEFMQQLEHVGLRGAAYTGYGLANPDNTYTDSSSGNGETIAEIGQALASSSYFQRTFGAVFANGFDLSCWNSSFSETKAVDSMEVLMPQVLRNSGILTNPNQTTLNSYLRLISIIHFHYNWYATQSKFVKCTRKGGEVGVKLINAFLDKTLKSLSGQLGRLERLPDGSENNSSLDYPGYKKITHARVIPIMRYKITGSPVSNTPVNSGGGVISTPYVPQIPQSPYTPDTPTQNTASMGKTVGYVAIAAAILYGANEAMKQGKKPKK